MKTLREMAAEAADCIQDCGLSREMVQDYLEEFLPEVLNDAIKIVEAAQRHYANAVPALEKYRDGK